MRICFSSCGDSSSPPNVSKDRPSRITYLHACSVSQCGAYERDVLSPTPRADNLTKEERNLLISAYKQVTSLRRAGSRSLVWNAVWLQMMSLVCFFHGFVEARANSRFMHGHKRNVHSLVVLVLGAPSLLPSHGDCCCCSAQLVSQAGASNQKLFQAYRDLVAAELRSIFLPFAELLNEALKVEHPPEARVQYEKLAADNLRLSPASERASSHHSEEKKK